MKPELHSLAMLLCGDTAATPEVARARRASYWDRTVQIQYEAKGREATGTGILLTSYGHVLTNHHVLPTTQATTIKLHAGLPSSQKFAAEMTERLIKYENYDLMLVHCNLPDKVRIAIEKLPPVVLGTPEAGNDVRVYGFNAEIVEERTGRILRKYGNQTAAQQAVFGADNHMKLIKYGMTWVSSTDIDPGHSGSPVVDAASGTLIGISFAELIHRTTTGEKLREEHTFTSAEGIRTLITKYLTVATREQYASAQNQ